MWVGSLSVLWSIDRYICSGHSIVHCAEHRQVQVHGSKYLQCIAGRSCQAPPAREASFGISAFCVHTNPGPQAFNLQGRGVVTPDTALANDLAHTNNYGPATGDFLSLPRGSETNRTVPQPIRSSRLWCLDCGAK